MGIWACGSMETLLKTDGIWKYSMLYHRDERLPIAGLIGEDGRHIQPGWKSYMSD